MPLTIVLLDTSMTREQQLTRDAEVIRRSLRQYEAGDSKELHAFMDEVQAKLLAMKDAPKNVAEK